MWILTAEWNLYDQMGEYFIDAFLDKPTPEQIQSSLGIIGGELVDHILKGGGRLQWEETWYFLREVEGK